jgi:fibronectin-binding autotransporter adhesin
MSITLTPVGNTQTFGTWLTRTNQILQVISTNTVTADASANGSVTTGNATVNGVFGANTVYIVNALSGGSPISTGWSNAVLTITSNLSVSNATAFFGNSSANVVLGYLSSASAIQENFGNQNNFVAMYLQNVNSGISASADFAIYNDNVAGFSGNNFIDMGITSSNYSNVSWQVGGANDGYLYTGNGNLTIGTSAAKYISFFANGTLSTNEVMRIDAGANVGIGTIAPNAKLAVTGTANVSGNVAIGGTLNVAANTTIIGIVTHTTNTVLSGNTYVNAPAVLSNTLTVTGNVTLSNTLSTTGNVTFSNTLNVTGLVTVNTINGTTANLTTINANTINILAGGTISDLNTLSVTGNSTFTSNVVVNGNTYLNNSAILANTFSVVGNATFSNTVSITGLTTVGSINGTTANLTTINANLVNHGANVIANTSAYLAPNFYANTINSTSNGFYANSSTIVVGNSSVNTTINAANVTIGNPGSGVGLLTTYNFVALGQIFGAFSANGSIMPQVNNTFQIGNASNTFAQVYTNSTYTSTLSAISSNLTINANTTANGYINVQSGYIQLNNTALVVTNTASLSGTAANNIDVFAKAAYRSGEYFIELTDGTSYQLTKILVVHDGGINAYSTEFGQVTTGTILGTFAANTDATNLRLWVTPTGATTTIKFMRNTLAV